MRTSYLTYADYCRKRFGGTVQKIAVDGGFTCPNRDGTLGLGGCTFCAGEAFAPSYCRTAGSITEQIDEGIRFHTRRHRQKSLYLAYFQSYSNTYAPLEVLRARYEEALAHSRVSGIVISTRPDCVSEPTLDLLRTLGKQKYIAVEYGIESCYDQTLRTVHRGHTFECTRQAILATAARGIDVGGHLILGLPGESREQMLAEADILSALPLSTLKLHQLQLLRGTEMERQWRSGWPPLCLHAIWPTPPAVGSDPTARISPTATSPSLSGTGLPNSCSAARPPSGPTSTYIIC